MLKHDDLGLRLKMILLCYFMVSAAILFPLSVSSAVLGKALRGLFGKINLGDGKITGKLDPLHFLNYKGHPS